MSMVVTEENVSMILPEHIREVFSKAICLYSKAEVDVAFDNMAAEINHKMGDTNPIFLCVVVGGIIPMGNLLPRLDFPLEADYVHVTRYKKTTTGKNIEWKKQPSTSLRGRTVIIVDDILDVGITLNAIVEYCRAEGAKAVFTAVLVDKEEARAPGGLKVADFCGLRVGNHYVFGYGMDYKGYLRNAPGIYMIAPEYEQN